MPNELTPHFSRKILFLSFIFLLANLGIYGLRSLSYQPTELKSLVPRLVSATISEIEVKSPYDETFKPAEERQEIYAGSSVKTGEKVFAELSLDENIIRLNEQTELRLIRNNFTGSGAYVSNLPRLEFELISGSIWVNAFDTITVRSPRSLTSLRHSVAMITYTDPINRLMVLTGAADLGLLKKNGEPLSDFVVPLNNQVTFVDPQITETYAQLKPSKLKKELKMAPIANEVLADDWVVRNVNRLRQDRAAFSDTLITSKLSYRLRAGYQTVISYLTFTPEARRALALEQANTLLAYLLGAVQESGDLDEAQKIVDQFNGLVEQRNNDPKLSDLIVQTLFKIDNVPSGTPANLLKENLIEKVAQKEGAYVFSIYLTDIRRAFSQKDTKEAEAASEKWLTAWKAGLKTENRAEFDRQAQILNYTIQSAIDIVTPAVLSVFDQSGMMILARAADTEETRYEVISNRLQIAASLIASYRYSLAKQYLKDSYLSLGIEELSPELASTQIFLAIGKLLAQRIEYAEAVLHGAAQPIDETKFRNYFQTLQRDEALSADLRKFFELDQEESATEVKIAAPTAAQVAGRFLDARINVNFADISLRPETGFTFDIKNARLIDKGIDGKTLVFDAIYDYASNSVTDVAAFEKTFKGPFTLSDVIILMKGGGDLGSRTSLPTVQEGIELFITDQEKIQAQEGQAIAQDVARQLAYSQLTSYGIAIPELKFDIEILDALNLNRFHIVRGLIPRPGEEESISISFDYSSATGDVTNVISQEGVTLIEKTTAKDLSAQVLSKVMELEKQLEDIGAFKVFVDENDMRVPSETLVYTPAGLIAFKDLELLSMGLKVAGFYDPATKLLVSVTHPLLSMTNIGIKDYFKMLSDQVVLDYMSKKGFSLSIAQIQSRFPFTTIDIRQLNVGGYLFSFTLDMTNGKALKIAREGTDVVIDELTLEELKVQPELIRPTEANTIAE